MLREGDAARQESDRQQIATGGLRRPQQSSSSPAADRIRTVTAGTFDGLILRGIGPIAVEFMTYGCAHCRAIEPVLQQLAEALEGKETLFKVNIAVDGALANSFEVRGTPTFIMFLNGKEVGRADGPHPNVPSVLSALTQPFE